MVERVYLGLDFKGGAEIHAKGKEALAVLRKDLGPSFVAQRIGVKLNLDAFIGAINPAFADFPHVFADLKIDHGSGTGKRTMALLKESGLDIELVTVASTLGAEIMAEYVEGAKQLGIGIVAFTVHTNISPEECERIYSRLPYNQIPILAGRAQEAGCVAIVCEGKMLTDPALQKLNIGKLVTGIRTKGAEAGLQKRATDLDQLAEVRHLARYAVISSKNVEVPETLPGIVRTLFGEEAPAAKTPATAN